MNPTFVYNQAQNGIELTFPDIPSRDVREQMKSHGFRYHRGKNIWYAKQTKERDTFARSLCGKEEIVKEAPEQEKLYRYYTRRPVDLGTFPKRDGSPVNIVNYDSRIPVEDGSIRAWGYVEYAKALSQKDIDDYELTPAPAAAQKEVPVTEKEARKAEKKKTKETPVPKESNTFAAHYDSIGGVPALDNGDVDLFKHHEAYIRDLNLHFRRYSGGDSIHITELQNAGKNGKACDKFAIFMRNGTMRDSVVCRLMNDYDIRTISQLYAALKAGKEFDREIQVEKRELKGVEVFSPFAETKPLPKIPERWNKRNFANALLSGQIYGGRIDQRLTDDYAYDYAYNYMEGTPIDVIRAARNAVEDWSSLASVRSSDVKPDGTCKIDYYDGYSTSKTFFFDLNCNIKEGKRREEEREAGVQRHNEMLKRSCIQVPQESIDPGKIYQLTTIETGTNSGIYGTKTENLQGHVLRDRLDPERLYMDILSVSELQIQPDKIYSVSNFYNRPSTTAQPDDRIIDCGNWQNIVTGKALLELTGEGVYFPDIKEGYGEYRDYETAHKTIEKFVSGKSRFMLGQNSTDYAHSLECLEKEHKRASMKRGLQDLVRDAQQRTAKGPESLGGPVRDR